MHKHTWKHNLQNDGEIQLRSRGTYTEECMYRHAVSTNVNMNGIEYTRLL